jgi:hypothetical protein
MASRGTLEFMISSCVCTNSTCENVQMTWVENALGSRVKEEAGMRNFQVQ